MNIYEIEQLLAAKINELKSIREARYNEYSGEYAELLYQQLNSEIGDLIVARSQQQKVKVYNLPRIRSRSFLRRPSFPVLASA